MRESRLVKGCCPLDCQDTCAWVAEVDDGRVTAVRGAKDHPFTRGVLCAKVNDYPARTYAADRLLHPLRRVGPKGSGQFERISWDAALDLVAERFSAIAAAHGPEALLPHRYLGSMGVVQCRSPMRLFHALGASRVSGGICNVAANEGVKDGLPLGFDPEATVDSRLILLWGINILSTCHHHWHFIQEARRRHGARVDLPRPDPHADGPAMRRACGAPPRHRHRARGRHGPRDARGGTCRPRLRALRLVPTLMPSRKRSRPGCRIAWPRCAGSLLRPWCAWHVSSRWRDPPSSAQASGRSRAHTEKPSFARCIRLPCWADTGVTAAAACSSRPRRTSMPCAPSVPT